MARTKDMAVFPGDVSGMVGWRKASGLGREGQYLSVAPANAEAHHHGCSRVCKAGAPAFANLASVVMGLGSRPGRRGVGSLFLLHLWEKVAAMRRSAEGYRVRKRKKISLIT